MTRLLALLALVSFGLVAAAGCDSGPRVCPDGQIDTQDAVVGTGAEAATVNSTVLLTYVGRLTNGTEFDRGDNVRFQLPSLIPGFRLGMVGMRAGGRRTITIPATLGYGPNPQDRIPACSTLIFEVRLHDIVS